MSDKTKRTSGLDRRQLLAGAATGAMIISIKPSGVFAQSYPERPITIVVMYAAGGGTDTVCRKIADEMAKAKGWDINVINKPGAVGAVATKYVAALPADGYTVLGGSNFNKFGRVLGHLDATPLWKDWVFFHASNSFASWSVRKDSPYQTFQDVVDAAKADPGGLSISTSGTGGIWHELALIVADFAGIKLKFVPYKGGKPATLAGLQGEVDIAGGGVHEHIELVRVGDLRPLQQTSAEDIHVGDIVWPSVGTVMPAIKPFLPVGGTTEFVMRRDTPPEILAEVKDAFVAAVNSDGFKEMAASKYFQLDIKVGEAADRMAAQFETITVDIFNKYADQIGQEVKSASDLGLPAPSEFDQWWPPEGYQAPTV